MKKPLFSTYHIVIESGRKILVSNCKKINEYSPEKIEIALRDSTVIICGKDLTLCDFFGAEIQIQGIIDGISLKGGEHEK